MINQDDLRVLHALATDLVGRALGELVRVGRVSAAAVSGTWRVSIDAQRLREGQAAGTTIDDEDGAVVVVLPPVWNIDGLIWLIAHEAVHVAQQSTRELIPMYGWHVWRGKEYKTLPATDPAYAELPWEKEAFEREAGLRDVLTAFVKKHSSAVVELANKVERAIDTKDRLHHRRRLVVLAALEPGPDYGKALAARGLVEVDEVGLRTPMTGPTVYGTLRRLLMEGLIKVSAAVLGHGGRGNNRRYYELTPAGRTWLEERRERAS